MPYPWSCFQTWPVGKVQRIGSRVYPFHTCTTQQKFSAQTRSKQQQILCIIPNPCYLLSPQSLLTSLVALFQLCNKSDDESQTQPRDPNYLCKQDLRFDFVNKWLGEPFPGRKSSWPPKSNQFILESKWIFVQHLKKFLQGVLEIACSQKCDGQTDRQRTRKHNASGHCLLPA